MREAIRPFVDAVETEAELRGIMGKPGALAVGKQLDHLDRHCRSFISLSPFVLVGTSDASGRCDVSPAATSRGSCSWRGFSNAKARRELGWQPRYSSWRRNFARSAEAERDCSWRLRRVTTPASGAVAYRGP